MPLLLPFLLFLLLLLPHCTSLRLPTLLPWKSLPTYPLPVLESAGAVLFPTPKTPILLIFGGYISNTNLTATNSVNSLPLHKIKAASPTTTSFKWTKLPPMPKPLTHVAHAAVNKTLYTCGGFAGNHPGPSVSDCYQFDSFKKVWNKLAPLPAPRAGGGMVYVKQIHALIYASGIQREAGKHVGVDKPETWMLFLGDEQKQGWMSLPPMPNPRNHMAAVSVGGRYFFLGGQHQDREKTDNQDSVHEFDIWKRVWVQRKSLPKPVGHVSASVRAFWNGILIIGGILDGRKLSDQVLYYDILVDEWGVVGKFQRQVQSPVCDRMDNLLVCATGEGVPGSSNLAFATKLSVPVEV